MFMQRARRVILAPLSSAARVQEVFVIVGHLFCVARETQRGLA